MQEPAQDSPALVPQDRSSPFAQFGAFAASPPNLPLADATYSTTEDTSAAQPPWPRATAATSSDSHGPSVVLLVSHGRSALHAVR